MSHSITALLASVIVLVAYLNARSAKQKGLHFWRTFLLSVLGFSGVALLFIKLFS